MNSQTPSIAAALWFGAAIVIAAALGCSMFSTRSEAPADSTSFLAANGATTANLTPMPIEIAQDIAKISAGGQVEPVKPIAAAQPPTSPVPGTTPAPGAPASANLREPTSDISLHQSTGGKSVLYVVRVGDTLMKIAFEKFGNVYRWKEILNSNRERLKDGYNVLVVGSILQIDGVEYIVIERNGKPYLIRRGDTLVKISRGLYGTTAEWRALWQNNRQLIHNPNKIYADFTLYYRSLAKRNSALRPPASVEPAMPTQ